MHRSCPCGTRWYDNVLIFWPFRNWRSPTVFIENTKTWIKMFRNTFQSGFLSILYSIGSKPLQIWDKKGTCLLSLPLPSLCPPPPPRPVSWRRPASTRSSALLWFLWFFVYFNRRRRRGAAPGGGYVLNEGELSGASCHRREGTRQQKSWRRRLNRSACSARA